MSRRAASWAIMALVALPIMVGCQFLVYKICVKNQTDFYVDEFTVKTSGALTYPDGCIKNLPPGITATVRGFKPGSYDLRAIFDVSDVSVCEDTVELLGVEIETSNVCVTYEVQDVMLMKSTCDKEIYATLDYVL